MLDAFPVPAVRDSPLVTIGDRLPALEVPETLDPWTFVTKAKLVEDAGRLTRKLPHDIDFVVAISRSGLLPGSIVAYDLHLDLWTVSRNTGVQNPGHGFRMTNREFKEPSHVLLIDDTAANGFEMPACLAIVRGRFPAARITTAVVYCHPQARSRVDLCVALYPGMHYLEWNWQNAGHGARCGYDFDGILCRDFTVEECRTEAGYRAAMATIDPLFLPRRNPVPLVVTGRPESTRDLTLEWLDRHRVRVERLVMWDGEPHPPPEAVGPWKAKYFKDAGLVMVAESDPAQAAIIARDAGLPVLCPALGRVVPPTSSAGSTPMADFDTLRASAAKNSRGQTERRELAEEARECGHFRKKPNCPKIRCGRLNREVTMDLCIECVAMTRGA